MDNLIFPLSKKEAENSGKAYSSQANKDAVFPQRLRELRAKMGISQQKLATDIGVTKSTISLYEQGDNVPDIKTFVKIADYYKVPCDFLLGKTDSTKKENINIAERTGLSDDAIKVLGILKKQSEVELDDTDPDYISLFSARREFKHMLTIINFLLRQEIITPFTVPVLNYIEMARKLQKKKESYLGYKALIEQIKDEYGDDAILEMKSPVVEEVINNVNRSNPNVTPYEDFRQGYEIQDLETQSDFFIWRMVENHKEFMLRVADELMERFEEMSHEV